MLSSSCVRCTASGPAPIALVARAALALSSFAARVVLGPAPTDDERACSLLSALLDEEVVLARDS